jgi:hypothetical protein
VREREREREREKGRHREGEREGQRERERAQLSPQSLRTARTYDADPFNINGLD